MTREEASFYLVNMDRKYMEGGMSEALDMAIKALEQEPCGDAISRQAVIDLLYGEVKETYTISNGRITYRITDINVDDLMNIPSVTPQPCEDAAGKLISTDVFDKMKGEFISRYPKDYTGDLQWDGTYCAFSLNEVLDIIDKYKTESEDKE